MELRRIFPVPDLVGLLTKGATRIEPLPLDCIVFDYLAYQTSGHFSRSHR